MTEKIPARFSRLELILQAEGLAKLSEAKVLVLGLGGVGSACAEALARGGVGHLFFVDGDRVDESNINRQALAFNSTVGRLKTEVMEAMVGEINPDCQVLSRNIFLTQDNLKETLSSFPKPDYVIDCIDTVAAKLGVVEWCLDEGLPLLSSMGAANKLDPGHLCFDRIEKTSHCSLSKVIRLECRKRGIENLEVLYSKEVPLKLDRPASRQKAKTLGSMSYMPPIMGMMLAGKVIRRLVGLEAKARDLSRRRLKEGN